MPPTKEEKDQQFAERLTQQQNEMMHDILAGPRNLAWTIFAFYIIAGILIVGHFVIGLPYLRFGRFAMPRSREVDSTGIWQSAVLLMWPSSVSGLPWILPRPQGRLVVCGRCNNQLRLSSPGFVRIASRK